MKLNKKTVTVAGLSALCALALAACGGFVYTTVGGTIKGLTTDSTLVLVNDTSYSHTATADGTFSFTLTPGTYTMQAGGGAVYPRCSPVTVVIKTSATVRADISCDTGIR